ncbi:unnamed protein product [Didymodactylos carnosus]|uniref:Uncharacterized protein n=1 Tax=Didymodactylos carnosus TaxID=1234261 RepID=A0A813X9G3_9BILA|nr:unnamed protein product [Didymodactylos carnosus]CAF0862101.1 unnamed protein product [Didymodactylos carnosus]CAF3639206.1 unnamed protein product [Didymodactylos carnosus]CAF3649755.1 unnamed protein product [Didymodactylos carnosus]
MTEPNNNKNNNADLQPPPPPYLSAVYKIEDIYSRHGYDAPPPSYIEQYPYIDQHSNYPGPPDNQIPGTNTNIITLSLPPPSMSVPAMKKLRMYLAVNGIITVLFGITAIGLQIGLLASNVIVYYYYGFWAGALVLGVGFSTLAMISRTRTIVPEKLFSAFVWQMVFVAVVFAFAIMIVATDMCRSDKNINDTVYSCKKSSKIINGLLITVFALTLLQAIINTVVARFIKRKAQLNAAHIILQNSRQT